VALGTALVRAPGARHEYSDLGPDVLAWVVEAVTRSRFEQYVDTAVFRRLGMTRTRFRLPPAERRLAAATENRPPRGYPLRGEVHDENAHALGGVAGHAGVFSTARDVARFAQAMLGVPAAGRPLASDSTISRFVAADTALGRQALLWQTCAGGGSCGSYMSRRAFGHTGYAGTSLWVDPESGVFVVVLTNWVHARPGAGTSPMAVVQELRADIADLAALAVADGPNGLRPLPSALRADRAIGWR
jgi:CubicO group peptidase (beta-lactamase class C family)